ncbi:MAG: hypothetical protein GXO23_00895 [Crenarchaeota archaeon]|nr:hypothetical protein [Thermoproteota archaeon]
MLRLSRRLIFLIVLILALVFYSLSAYGIWSVTLIPDVIKTELSSTQLAEIYTMYSICVILTVALGIVTYLLIQRAQTPAGTKKKAYITSTASTLVLVAAFIILLVACVTSYYYLAQVTAPLAP